MFVSLNNLDLLLIWMIEINHDLVMNVLYVRYVVVNVFIGVVALNLIPFPPNLSFDSSIICDIGMGDEAENAKQEAHNVNSLMECKNMLGKANSKISKQLVE